MVSRKTQRIRSAEFVDGISMGYERMRSIKMIHGLGNWMEETLKEQIWGGV